MSSDNLNGSGNGAKNDLRHLVPVKEREIGGAIVPTCDLKELHTYLGVGRFFHAWVESRITKYGFIEGQDYVTAQNLSDPKLDSAKSRAQRTKDYFGTLDMGKELAMVENNPKGKEARRYFIECEKKVHGLTQRANQAAALHPIITDPAVAAHLAVPREERQLRQRDAELYRKATGIPGMRWFMWNAGYPIPPKHILGHALQHELELMRQPRTITVTVAEAA